MPLAPSIKDFLFQTCSLTLVTGEGNDGDPVYGSLQANIPCQFNHVSKQVTQKSGVLAISRGYVIFEGNRAITNASKVLFDSVEYRVIESRPVWGDDQDTPHHFEIWVA